MQVDRGEDNKRGGLRSRMLLVLAVLAAAVVGLALWRVGPAPEIEILPAMPGIGPRTPVEVRLRAPGRGLSDFRVELVQGEAAAETVSPLIEQDNTPRPFWAFWGARRQSAEVTVEIGRETVPQLRAGEATVRVVAERAGSWLRHPSPAIAELTLPVRLEPPPLMVLSRAVSVTQGGSGLVVYRTDPAAARDGVRAGTWWFPGYPLPGGGEGERFCLFAAPYDQPDTSELRLVAEDEVGNRTETGFVTAFTARPPRQATIELSEAFMARVVPEILARSPEIRERDTLLASYQAVNGELRRKNAESLRELSKGSRPEFLWSEPFRQLGNSQVMASFADRRTYRLDGEAVDQQDHLGFDLASFRRAPVEASNRGVVALAEYFGIYGNTVVLDHGYGLMSLYSHLSSIDVEVGQTVAMGETLGRTGETGLAGGDHLHFSLMVHGLPVNPLEWWDPAWVRNRIREPLASP
jgi:murein DD-endopeptidase MepM/ murein hydrolase activator NlpD